MQPDGSYRSAHPSGVVLKTIFTPEGFKNIVSYNTDLNEFHPETDTTSTSMVEAHTKFVAEFDKNLTNIFFRFGLYHMLNLVEVLRVQKRLNSKKLHPTERRNLKELEYAYGKEWLRLEMELKVNKQEKFLCGLFVAAS